MPICPKFPSLLSTPSSEKLLLVGRAPFTTSTEPPDSRKRVDSVEVPTGLPPPPSKFPPPPITPTMGRVTPGDSVASSVKLRCAIGRSVTCLPVITSPRTLVSLSVIGTSSAVTVTDPAPPVIAVNFTSSGRRAFVSTTTSSKTTFWKPAASTVTVYRPGSRLETT